MDVIEHLTEEHRKAEKLIQQLESSEPGTQREKTLAELTDALKTHMAVEEEFLYGIVERVLGEDKKEGAENEHRLARDGLKKAEQLSDEEGFKAAVEMIKAGIDHHVKEEEKEIFPGLREKAADEIRALGDPEQLELQVKTRDQLYEKATELDITGRSAMSKEQLQEAISEAE